MNADLVSQIIEDGTVSEHYQHSNLVSDQESTFVDEFVGVESSLFTSSFCDVFKRSLEKLVPQTEKNFNYRVLMKTDVEGTGVLELPPLDMDNKMLPKSVGVSMITELALNHKFTELKGYTSPDVFSKLERYLLHPNYEPVNLFFFNSSFYIGTGYMLVVLDVDPNHYLYQMLGDQYFRVIQFGYDCVSFAFLESKLIYYHRRGVDGVEGATFLFSVPVKSYLFSYFSYVLSRYGKCDSVSFYKSMKRKASARTKKKM